MKSAIQWFVEKLIDHNYSQHDGMLNIKIPSWEFLEFKHQAQDLEKELNKNQFGKGQEWEHKNIITSDDTQVSKTFLEAEPQLPQQEISDEEIDKWVASTPYYGHCTPEYKEGLEEGAKWYREQLKSKGNGER